MSIAREADSGGEELGRNVARRTRDNIDGQAGESKITLIVSAEAPTVLGDCSQQPPTFCPDSKAVLLYTSLFVFFLSDWFTPPFSYCLDLPPRFAVKY